MSKNKIQDQNIISCQSNDGQISFDVSVLDETIWLTQKQVGNIFDKNQKTISNHIQNIYKEG